MKLGIYSDLRNPPQWRRDSSQTYGVALEMCQEAEKLGIASVWFSEHHLFEDGYLPQPLTMAAAVAACTTTIRIGTAVVVAPLRHPVHLAEEAALVDIISAGRLELGLGAGYRQAEFELFGRDIGQRYAETDATVAELRRLWAGGALTPPPVQDPVPIWLGYQGPRGARRAGRSGEALLSADPALEAPYRQGLAEGGHDQTTARMAGFVTAYASQDPERDWGRLKEHHFHQWESYRQESVIGTDLPKPRRFNSDLSRKTQIGGRLGDIVVDTPDVVAQAIFDYVGTAPVETVLVFLSPGALPDELAFEHLHVLANDVVPLLASREQEPPASRSPVAY